MLKNSEMDLSLFLKTETLSVHKEVEKISPLFRPEFSVESYKKLLSAFLPYFQAYERAIDSFKKLQVPNPQLRLNRSKWLAQDLDKLNVKDLITVNTSAPVILDSRAEALGMMYVMEGSSLGGQFIAKQLQQKLFLKEDQLSFYRGYGTQTAELWNEFKDFLDTHQLNPKEMAAALTSAKQTFEDMGKLMVSASN